MMCVECFRRTSEALKTFDYAMKRADEHINTSIMFALYHDFLHTVRGRFFPPKLNSKKDYAELLENVEKMIVDAGYTMIYIDYHYVGDTRVLEYEFSWE